MSHKTLIYLSCGHSVNLALAFVYFFHYSSSYPLKLRIKPGSSDFTFSSFICFLKSWPGQHDIFFQKPQTSFCWSASSSCLVSSCALVFFTSDRSCVFSIFTPSVVDSLFASEIKGKIYIFLLFFILNLVWFVFDLQNFKEK